LVQGQGGDDELESSEIINPLDTYDSEYIIGQAPKLAFLVDLVRHFRDTGHRTLIFSQSVKILNIIETVISHEVNILRIDGSTKEIIRQLNVDDFNSSDIYDVMLLSTKAAGVGLTLTGADRVVVYDPSWSPSEDNQAVDRAYRIGQKKEVVVYRLISSGTVEERIYEKQVSVVTSAKLPFRQTTQKINPSISSILAPLHFIFRLTKTELEGWY